MFVLPLVQMVMTSFMSNAEINRFPPRFFPSHLSLAGYRGLLAESDVLPWFANSLMVTVVAVSPISCCARWPATASPG